jgi:hypothetical protein
MGDAPATKAKQEPAEKVALVIGPSSHADIADLDEGQVSKTKPLVVSRAVARRLLACHPYLEAMEG